MDLQKSDYYDRIVGEDLLQVEVHGFDSLGTVDNRILVIYLAFQKNEKGFKIIKL